MPNVRRAVVIVPSATHGDAMTSGVAQKAFAAFLGSLDAAR
jgi:hypothetical protein